MGGFPHTKLISQRNHQQNTSKSEANQPCYPESPLPGSGDGRAQRNSDMVFPKAALYKVLYYVTVKLRKTKD